MSTKIKIAITGTSGHLAAPILPLLQNNGFVIQALQYKEELSSDLKNLQVVKGSLFDTESLNRLVTGCDIVIHSAAKISINSNRDDSVYNTNVNGTKNVFYAAKAANVKRFIYISSIHAYNQFPSDKTLDEAHPFCNDNSPQYDLSKRDAQKFILAQTDGLMEVVVLNPTAIIGPNDYKPSLLGQAIIDMYNNRVPSLIKGGFDFCDVRDVANGIVNAIHSGRNGHSYLLSGKWYSLADFHQIIMDIKGEKRKLAILPPWVGYLGLPFIRMIASVKNNEPLYTKESLQTLVHSNKKISNQKAVKELFYNTRPLKDTIADSISWFQQNGYLQ